MKIIIFVSFFIANSSFAKLAQSSFKDFLKDSELILEATPSKSEWSDKNAGYTDLKVKRVVWGDYKEPMIRISWSLEVHDQPIDNMGTDWLLFLKKNSKTGQYIGSTYGRSFWKLNIRSDDRTKTELDWPGRGAYFEYPLTMITLSGEAKKKLIIKQKNSCNQSSDFISIGRLIKYIGEQKK